MNTTLYLTQVDHFCSPDVLHRARECRDAGWNVAWLTRDEQPFYAPDTEISVWTELIGYRPDLAILDNLRFDDRNGQVITHLQREVPTVVPRLVLEQLLEQLCAAGTREVILVCEQDEVSEAWQAHLARLQIRVLRTDAERCRHWHLIDQFGKPYEFADRRLETQVEKPRMVQALFRTPESEALLALVCAYIEIEYEYANTDYPAGGNKRWDDLKRILQASDCDQADRHMQERIQEDLALLFALIESACFGSRPTPPDDPEPYLRVIN